MGFPLTLTSAMVFSGLLALGPGRPSVEPPVATPAMIMFYGDLLTEPSFAHTVEDVHGVLMNGGGDVYSRPLDGRPYIELKLFWNYQTWARHAADAQLRKTLRPEDADETCVLLKCNGRYYPASGSEPAVLFAEVYGQHGRHPSNVVVDAAALAVLERLGLPKSVGRQEPGVFD
jgi:hypothetical protein